MGWVGSRCYRCLQPQTAGITHVEGCPEQTKVAARWYMDDIITKPFQYDDGCLLVPDGPGLGVEIDREKLKKYSETK